MRRAPGETVSHYQILDVLGEGGMGIVYRAQDLKLPREVALKFLPDYLTREDEARKRFINEARTVSSLQHPNICVILDIDETVDGQTFIVMPCYRGETLRSRLDRSPVDQTTAVRITSQIADGLAQAHARGFVHRDIKPENILITDDGNAILMDFGLARLAGGTKVTRTGNMVGTVAYMSPEQATGGTVDHRSDIFSMGVVLYEMLMGRRPFTGEHHAAVQYAIVHLDPAPWREDVPEPIRSAVSVSLRKSPDDRYANVLQLRDDLSGMAPFAKPAPTRARLRASLWVGLGALAIALAVGAKLWWTSSTKVEHSALAVIGFRDLSNQNGAITSAGITELVNVGLIENSPIRLISAEYLHDMKRRLFGSSSGSIADDQALEIARKAGATLLLSGSIGLKGGIPFVTWRLVEVNGGANLAAKTVEGADPTIIADAIVAGAMPALEQEARVIDTTPPRPVAEMTTANPQSFQHYLAGLIAASEGREEASLVELKKAVETDPTFALAHFELARSALGMDQQLVDVSVQNAWKLRSSLSVKDRMRLEAFRERLSGSRDGGLDTYREIAERWPEDREALRDYGGLLSFYWYFDKGIDVIKKGVALYPDDPTFLIMLSAAQFYGGHVGESLRTSQRLTTIQPRNPNAWDELGLKYLEFGIPDSADVAFRKALQIDPTFRFSREGLAYSSYCRGNISDAIMRIESIVRSESLSPDTRAALLGARDTYSLAFLYAETGQFTKALELNRTALKAAAAANAVQTTQIAHFEQALLLAKKDYAGAIACNRRAQQYLSDKARLSWFNMELYLELDSLAAARREFDHVYYPNRYHWGLSGIPFVLFRKGRLLLKEGQPDSALTYFDQTRKLGFARGITLGYQSMQYRHEYARALQAAGRPEEAIAVLSELMNLCKGHAIGHYELGKLYEELRRRDEARKEYTTFLEMWAQADEGLPQVIDARKRLKALSG